MLPVERESIGGSPGRGFLWSPILQGADTPQGLRNSVPLSSPSSSLSELDPSSQSSVKKRRASTSSLSDADNDLDDSEEEDRPLASQLSTSRSVPGKSKPPGKRSHAGKSNGKKAKKVHTFAGDDDRATKGKSSNGLNGHKKVKEEKLDTGVPADSTTAMRTPAVSGQYTQVNYILLIAFGFRPQKRKRCPPSSIDAG